MCQFSDVQWKRLYGALGLIDGEDGFKTLARTCPQRTHCWRVADEVLPPNDPEKWGIYRPWVGPRYEESRIVVVAQNMNMHGGWPAMVDLVTTAKTDLAEGKRRLRFGNPWGKYRGTLLFHRAGAFATFCAASMDLIRPQWLWDGFPVPAQVSQAFDFVAMTNVIKCSPNKDGSPPTPGMWERCAPYVLKHELVHLKPAVILVLGLQSLWPVLAYALDQAVEVSEDCGNLRVATGKVDGQDVRIIAVPHPHARGYLVGDVMTDLKRELGFGDTVPA